MDTYDFVIADCYLPAIVNGDYSGLSDTDIDILSRFLDNPLFSLGHWSVSDDTDEFCLDDVSGLYASCTACEFVQTIGE